MGHYSALFLPSRRASACFLTHTRLSSILFRSHHSRHWLPVPRNPNALSLHCALHQLLESSFRFCQSNGQHDSYGRNFNTIGTDSERPLSPRPTSTNPLSTPSRSPDKVRTGFFVIGSLADKRP